MRNTVLTLIFNLKVSERGDKETIELKMAIKETDM